MSNPYSIDKFETKRLVLIPREGEAIDLRPFLQQLKIRENMDDMFITGSVKIRIPKGLFPELESFPKAQDLLDINIRSVYKIPTKKLPPPIGSGSIDSSTSKQEAEPSSKSADGTYLQGTFFVNNIKSNRSLDFIHDEMVLEFITAEGFRDKTRKIQKSYKKKKRSEIIKQVYNDFLREDTDLSGDAESEHNFTCVIPNWTPSKTIHWLLKGCYKDKDKNYLFYQRFNKGNIETRFDKFSDIAKKDPIVGRRDKPASGFIESIDVAGSLDETEDLERRLRFVNSVSSIQRVNTLEQGMVGAWGSKASFYDMTRKKYLRGKEVNNGKGEFSYKEDAEDPQIDDYKKFVVSDDLDEKDFFVVHLPKCQYLFHNDEEKEGVDRTEEWVLEHQSQKSLNSFYTLEITSIGDTSVSIGETVTYANSKGINFKDEEKPVEQKLDDDKKEFGGTYILWGIERVFDFPRIQENFRGECKNIMTLVRDGWAE